LAFFIPYTSHELVLTIKKSGESDHSHSIQKEESIWHNFLWDKVHYRRMKKAIVYEKSRFIHKNYQKEKKDHMDIA